MPKVTTPTLLLAVGALGALTVFLYSDVVPDNDQANTEMTRLNCVRDLPTPSLASPTTGMAWIPSGEFTIGIGAQYPEEFPERLETSGGFWMMQSEVTNKAFAAFVEATGYVTEAETGPAPEHHPGVDPAMLVPGGAVFVAPTSDEGRIGSWWQFRERANWRSPDGSGSIPDNFDNLPVVHVTYRDAKAYASWLGHDLPSETEWEYAARGGGTDSKYAWGEDYMPGGKPQANTWQGFFPLDNSADDGFIGAAPPGCFKANGYGLYDMIGNVWELTKSQYTSNHAPNARQSNVHVVMKGGSFLCAPNYCQRYRPAARQPQEMSFTTNHTGFRTVYRSPGPSAEDS